MKYLRLYENLESEFTLQDYFDMNGIYQGSEYQTGRASLDVDNKILNCGRIGITSLKGIEQMTSLQQLSCTYNKLKSLAGIEHFINLNYILAHTNPIDDITAVSDLVNLKYLSCGYGNVSSLSAVKKLVNIKELMCSFSKLKNLDGIEELSLIKLFVPGNPWAEPLPLELVKKYNIDYEFSPELKTYEYQKKFMEDYPDRVMDLIPIGICHELEELRGFVNME